MTGSMLGGGIGGALATSTCVAFGVTTAGIGGVACAVIAGGIGAAAGGAGGGSLGVHAGEILRNAIHD